MDRLDRLDRWVDRSVVEREKGIDIDRERETGRETERQRER